MTSSIKENHIPTVIDHVLPLSVSKVSYRGLRWPAENVDHGTRSDIKWPFHREYIKKCRSVFKVEWQCHKKPCWKTKIKSLDLPPPRRLKTASKRILVRLKSSTLALNSVSQEYNNRWTVSGNKIKYKGKGKVQYLACKVCVYIYIVNSIVIFSTFSTKKEDIVRSVGCK